MATCGQEEAFLEKVGNCIDLDNYKFADRVHRDWSQLHSSNAISKAQRRQMEYYGITTPRSSPLLVAAGINDDGATSIATPPLARVLQEAASVNGTETTTSSSTSSDFAYTRRGRSELPNTECLSEYPVDWHIAQALVKNDDVAVEINGIPHVRKDVGSRDTPQIVPPEVQHITEADQDDGTLIRCWHMYTDCDCCGLTRYYLQGEHYSHFLPPVIKARPPCCFNKVYLNLRQDSSVLITDSKNRCLGLFKYPAPKTFQPDPVSRDPEEAMIICLYENMWWLAHEFCSEIHIAVDCASYSPAKKPYRTQLAFPSQAMAKVKTNLSITCSYLENVYPHVKIIH